MSAPIIGIDLGTTFSLAANFRDGVPQLVPNLLGETLTPSAVGLGPDGELLVGAPARAQAVLRPESTVLAFKRDMGTLREYRLGNKRFTPTQLSALVLKSLKADAEAFLDCAVEEAVVTVPAYFNDLQRQATRDAGALAGLKVERIINEPTAAALAYGLNQSETAVRAIVLDLGGGTFDVTVLESVQRVVEIQASAGDTRLGGEDFVDLLVEHVSRLASQPLGVDLRADAKSHARLRDACERLMHRLSSEERVELVLNDPRGEGSKEVFRTVVERAEAEEIWRPLLARLSLPIRRALRDARVGESQLDEALLVGGASRIPCVARLFEELVARPPLRTLNPDEAVALGAAVQGALKARDASVEDLVVTDVAPFTLGIRTAADFNGRMVGDLFSPILERGTVIPASRVERFNTIQNRQRTLRVEVFQGEHPTCAQNTAIGQYLLKGIPPGPAGQEAIDVRFTYDLNGLLEVDMTLVSSGKTETFVIEQRPGALSPAEFEKARNALSRLKMHPRESLPNATALARAEAAYVELTGEGRRLLGIVMGQFRAALERQEPKAIEEARAALVGLTRSLLDG
jgi:molecular chaperone HscC